jgi:hypothetical protein
MKIFSDRRENVLLQNYQEHKCVLAAIRGDDFVMH